jgi:indolepyruvate ferredoxin oxidoreductase
MKKAYGPWMLRAMGWLRHGKALRGTALDPFGRTEERRTGGSVARGGDADLWRAA